MKNRMQDLDFEQKILPQIPQKPELTKIQKHILKMELQKKLTKDKKQRCKMRMSPLGRHPFCSFRGNCAVKRL